MLTKCRLGLEKNTLKEKRHLISYKAWKIWLQTVPRDGVGERIIRFLTWVGGSFQPYDHNGEEDSARQACSKIKTVDCDYGEWVGCQIIPMFKKCFPILKVHVYLLVNIRERSRV